MAWIESHQSLARHPKTLRLARELKCSVPCAIGYLHLLWWWALDYAGDGLVSADDMEAGATACMWSKRSEQFWSALMTAGFVEESETECALRIHDWFDYAGRLVEKRRKNAERKRAVRGTSAGRDPDVSRTSGPPDTGRPGATVHNQPDRTGPTGQTTPPEPPPTNETDVRLTAPTDSMTCYGCEQLVDTLDYKTQHSPGCDYAGLYPLEIRARRGMLNDRAKRNSRREPVTADTDG